MAEASPIPPDVRLRMIARARSPCRPCAMRRPTPRRSRTSCSSAAASSARSARDSGRSCPRLAVHRKVEIVREEMDAIGAQEMFAPVLTPAELWITSAATASPSSARGPERPRLRPPAHARGDVHVPRARAAELPAAAAVLVPLPDEGPGRAAPARRSPARPRVHHEGLVLFDRDEAGLDISFQAHGARTSGSGSAAGSRTYGVQAESGMMGGSESLDYLARPRARTRSSPARTATTRPTSRSRAASAGAGLS